jgi:preprotein translocase subunit Sec63
MKINKKKIAILCMVLLSVLASGCGKEKTVDEASSQVIQISVAPVEATPTPAPDQVDSAAVITNGNLTMVNNYLADQSTTDISASEISDSGNNANTDTSIDGGTDASTDSNTEDNSAVDSEE